MKNVEEIQIEKAKMMQKNPAAYAPFIIALSDSLIEDIRKLRNIAYLESDFEVTEKLTEFFGKDYVDGFDNRERRGHLLSIVYYLKKKFKIKEKDIIRR